MTMTRRHRNEDRPEQTSADRRVSAPFRPPSWREIPQALQSHPSAALATVGVLSFALGAVVGSRIGRLVMMAAIPALVGRILQGEVGDRIGRYAESLFRAPHESGSAD